MDNITTSQILHLIHREILPAIGCTEPAAVALAAAKAAETLGHTPERTDVFFKCKRAKNAMGVGIPGTGMVGLPIAVALGTVIADSSAGLEVLKKITPGILQKGKEMVAENILSVSLKEQVDKLYIEVTCYAGTDSATAIIARDHTRFIYIEKNGVAELDIRSSCVEADSADPEDELLLSYDLVYRFAMETPLEEIRFIRQTAGLNREAAQTSLQGIYGHTVGKPYPENMGVNIWETQSSPGC